MSLHANLQFDLDRSDIEAEGIATAEELEKVSSCFSISSLAFIATGFQNVGESTGPFHAI